MKNYSIMVKPCSGRCNLSCSYCFYRDEINNSSRDVSCSMMSEKTLKQLIKKALRSADGSVFFLFQGGEPTLCGLEFFEKVIYFQKLYNTKGLAIYNSLQTNGTLLNDDWCNFFHKNKFLIGISLDGIDSTHNLYRTSGTGIPSYDDVMSGIKLLSKHHVDFNILTVVTPELSAVIKDVYSYYMKNNWLYQQYIACLSPLHSKDTGIALSPEQYSLCMSKLFHMWKKDLLSGSAPYIRQFNNYVNMAKGYPPDSCDMFGLCQVQYVAESNGDIYPCDFYCTDKYLLGNINTGDFSSFDDKRLQIHFIDSSPNTSVSCLSCSCYQFCRGGCKRYRGNNFCKGQKLLFDKIGDEIYSLAHYL